MDKSNFSSRNRLKFIFIQSIQTDFPFSVIHQMIFNLMTSLFDAFPAATECKPNFLKVKCSLYLQFSNEKLNY